MYRDPTLGGNNPARDHDEDDVDAASPAGPPDPDDPGGGGGVVGPEPKLAPETTEAPAAAPPDGITKAPLAMGTYGRGKYLTLRLEEEDPPPLPPPPPPMFASSSSKSSSSSKDRPCTHSFT